MSAYNFFVCGPKFTIFGESNVGGVVVDQLLFRFSTGRSVREIFVIKVESCQILHVLGPQFFGERAPQFLDLHYKAHLDCDHVAKFHGNRPRELGDLVAKKRKKHQQ